MREPTARQFGVLRFIHKHIETHNIPPTLREIGKQFGIRSTNGVNDHMRALERKGLITRRDGLARSTRITHEGYSILAGVTPEISPADRPALSEDTYRRKADRQSELLRRVLPLLSELMPTGEVVADIRKELAR